jgi:DNA-binding NarL/FixJ family response regulator
MRSGIIDANTAIRLCRNFQVPFAGTQNVLGARAVADEIRVLIADDYPVVRSGIKASITGTASCKVIAEAGDGESALALLSKLKPHLAILDIDMPKLSGLEVAKEAARLSPSTKIIFLSFHRDPFILRKVLALGAWGYLLKDSAMDEIVIAIRSIIEGQVYVSSEIAVKTLAANSTSAVPENPLLRNLTEAERRILRLIADGLSTKEIAEQVSLHYRTIENQRNAICRKLNLEGGANILLRFAVQNKENLH